MPVSIVTTEDGTPIVGQIHTTVCAYDRHTGRLLWQFRGPESFWTTQVGIGSDNTLYVGTDDGFISALDARKGTLRWKTNIGKRIGSTPVISRDGVLYVGTRDTNQIFALNARTGETDWNRSFAWFTRSFPYGDTVFPAVHPNGMVYAASTDGNLYALYRP